MPGQFNFTYNVDIVMCIDATASMGPIIDKVKETALSLPSKFLAKMEDMGKHCDAVRFKVISFRDYKYDAEPMVESPFYDISEATDFQNFINNIVPDGGGDLPENALEALAYAFKSDWVTTGSKRRHVVVMFTDAAALPLGERKDIPGYPTDLPEDLMGLVSWYEGTADQSLGLKLEQKAKRLVLYTPHAEPWEDLTSLPGVIINTVSEGEGGDEINMDSVLELLVNSM
ncbi:MAG: VWA domain-containing protein [Clostridia bacterium]|nr:VWA domain-containing protein [Clostridia bacterium]